MLWQSIHSVPIWQWIWNKETTGLTITLRVLHAAALHATVPLLNVWRLYLAVCPVQQWRWYRVIGDNHCIFIAERKVPIVSRWLARYISRKLSTNMYKYFVTAQKIKNVTTWQYISIKKGFFNTGICKVKLRIRYVLHS